MRKLIFILCLGVAGCASDPSRIHAVYNPETKCDRSKLAGLEAAQRKTARADTVGVLLIGIPLGGQDYAKEIAELKGACK